MAVPAAHQSLQPRISNLLSQHIHSSSPTSPEPAEQLTISLQPDRHPILRHGPKEPHDHHPIRLLAIPTRLHEPLRAATRPLEPRRDPRERAARRAKRAVNRPDRVGRVAGEGLVRHGGPRGVEQDVCGIGRGPRVQRGALQCEGRGVAGRGGQRARRRQV